MIEARVLSTPGGKGGGGFHVSIPTHIHRIQKLRKNLAKNLPNPFKSQPRPSRTTYDNIPPLKKTGGKGGFKKER